jgi:hypothetical protein
VDEAPEPANGIDGLSAPDAELAEPAPNKTTAAEAATADPAIEPAEAPCPTSDAEPQVPADASINI